MSGKRRDAGRARGRVIEEAILNATLEDIAAHGPQGVSVSRVAAAAEVNKTSVYRRWATVELLVAAAIEHSLTSFTEQLSDQGSLQADLTQLVELLARRIGSDSGRALMRSSLASGPKAEGSERLTPSVPADAAGIVERALARGEWDERRTPAGPIVAMIVGAVMHRVLLEGRPVDAAWTESVVDMVVRGVAP